MRNDSRKIQKYISKISNRQRCANTFRYPIGILYYSIIIILFMIEILTEMMKVERFDKSLAILGNNTLTDQRGNDNNASISPYICMVRRTKKKQQILYHSIYRTRPNI